MPELEPLDLQGFERLLTTVDDGVELAVPGVAYATRLALGSVVVAGLVLLAALSSLFVLLSIPLVLLGIVYRLQGHSWLPTLDPPLLLGPSGIVQTRGLSRRRITASWDEVAEWTLNERGLRHHSLPTRRRLLSLLHAVAADPMSTMPRLRHGVATSSVLDRHTQSGLDGQVIDVSSVQALVPGWIVVSSMFALGLLGSLLMVGAGDGVVPEWILVLGFLSILLSMPALGIHRVVRRVHGLRVRRVPGALVVETDRQMGTSSQRIPLASVERVELRKNTLTLYALDGATVALVLEGRSQATRQQLLRDVRSLVQTEQGSAADVPRELMGLERARVEER